MTSTIFKFHLNAFKSPCRNPINNCSICFLDMKFGDQNSMVCYNSFQKKFGDLSAISSKQPSCDNFEVRNVNKADLEYWLIIFCAISRKGQWCQN
mmetsp:Transcript_28013/g.41365  ORF Transcript_28013/g.41365 Transcript_28013/m.41365 type:complete len:95 (+) Transcript_28013:1246-1530(+)